MLKRTFVFGNGTNFIPNELRNGRFFVELAILVVCFLVFTSCDSACPSGKNIKNVTSKLLIIFFISEAGSVLSIYTRCRLRSQQLMTFRKLLPDCSLYLWRKPVVNFLWRVWKRSPCIGRITTRFETVCGKVYWRGHFNPYHISAIVSPRFRVFREDEPSRMRYPIGGCILELRFLGGFHVGSDAIG